MAKRKGSLLVQLTVSLGLAIVFLSLASFFYQFQVERRILINSIREDLVHQASLIRAWLTDARTPEERRKIAGQYAAAIEHLDSMNQAIVIVDADRSVIGSNTGKEIGAEFASTLLDEAMAAGAPPEGVTRQAGGRLQTAVAFHEGPTGRDVRGGVLIDQPLTPVNQLADSLMLGAFILLLATLVIIVLVVYLVLRVKVHRPMHAIFMQQYRIREGDLARIDAKDPRNEFSDLYSMYNEMVEKLAQQRRATLEQKEYVALGDLVRQISGKITGPMDELIRRSRTLMERASSLSDEDRATLRELLANLTRIARELQGLVAQGDRSAHWIKRELDKAKETSRKFGDTDAEGRRYSLE
jgi:methyl-accepting chemotaxis protein